MASGKSVNKKVTAKELPIKVNFTVHGYEVSLRDIRRLMDMFLEEQYPLFAAMKFPGQKEAKKLSAARDAELTAEYQAWVDVQKAARLSGLKGFRDYLTPEHLESFFGTLLTGNLVAAGDWEPIDLTFTPEQFSDFYWALEDDAIDNLTAFIRSEEHRSMLLGILKTMREQCFGGLVEEYAKVKAKQEAEDRKLDAEREARRNQAAARQREDMIRSLRSLGYTVTPPKTEKAPNLPEIINSGMAETVSKTAFKPAAKKTVAKKATAKRT